MNYALKELKREALYAANGPLATYSSIPQGRDVCATMNRLTERKDTLLPGNMRDEID
jgi:hypothetical protein